MWNFITPSSRPLTLLTAPKATCMDGTLSGYYIRHSKQSAQTKWVLSLQGGGECVDGKCVAKAQSALGSSKFFPKEKTFEEKTHLIDSSCRSNPELCDYNLVWLPYCSQDLWTGNASSRSPTSSPAPGWYFSGHAIFGSVLDALTGHGLGNASQVHLPSYGRCISYPHFHILISYGRCISYPHILIIDRPLGRICGWLRRLRKRRLSGRSLPEGKRGRRADCWLRILCVAVHRPGAHVVKSGRLPH